MTSGIGSLSSAKAANGTVLIINAPISTALRNFLFFILFPPLLLLFIYPVESHGSLLQSKRKAIISAE